MAPAAASAQYFNHLSVGFGAGTDGLTLQVAAPVGDYVQLRALGSYWPPAGFTANPRLSWTTESGKNGSANVKLKAEAAFKGAGLMVDIFTDNDGPFRFTIGLGYGSPKVISIRNLEPFLDREDWGTSGIQVENTILTTDENGLCSVEVMFSKLRPYVGIGTGRAVPSLRRVSFGFDVGAYYTGPWGFYALGRNADNVAKKEYVHITSEALNHQDKDVIDLLGKFPVLPVIRLSMNVALF